MDSECESIHPGNAQAGDIIVYYSSSGIPLHSGVITSIESSGAVTIRSKWGQSGVYDHGIADVPPEYLLTSGTFDCEIFRYHGYHYYGILDAYIGEEYHSGSKHYYLTADYCRCGAQTNEHWISLPCTGPTCVYPWALPPTYEEM